MEYVQFMISNLGHYDKDTASKAKKDLLLQGKKAVPHLIAALTNPDQVIVAEIVQLLGFFGKEAKDAVKALVTLTYNHNPYIRAKAIASIGLIAENPKVCIPVLQRFMKDSDVDVRRHAIAALGGFTQDAYAAVVDLVESLEDEDAVVREFAACILLELGSVPWPLAEKIVGLVKEADPYVRYCLNKLLINMRQDSKKTSTKFLWDKSQLVQFKIA